MICSAGFCVSILGVICNAGLCAINNWCKWDANFVLLNSSALIVVEINFNFTTMNSSSYAETFSAF